MSKSYGGKLLSFLYIGLFQDSTGRSALHYCSHMAMGVNILLESGANPDLQVGLYFTHFCLSIFTVRKRSCGKVMFLHLSVSHSVHRGVSAPVHAGIHTPLGRHPTRRQTPLSRHPQADPPGRHPLGRHPPRKTPQEDPPQADTPRPGRHLPPGKHPPLGKHSPGRHPPSRRLLLRTVRILLECILV